FVASMTDHSQLSQSIGALTCAVGKDSPQGALTTLNLDCIYRIFSFLDRNTLDVMERVSSTMKELATHKQFDSIKRKKESLTITVHNYGHSLIVTPICKTNNHFLFDVLRDPGKPCVFFKSYTDIAPWVCYIIAVQGSEVQVREVQVVRKYSPDI
ncbi:hypothetical protein PFISCL1PPCAC_3212, partial [Pristionchus fissidentatus]